MTISKISKLTVASLLTLLLTWSFVLTTEAQGINQLKNKNIYINGNSYTYSVIEQDNYQLVPTRLFKQIGAGVTWDNDSKAIELSYNGFKVKLFAGERTAFYLNPETNEWNETNGLATKTTIIEGSSYIPLAYTSTKLGIDITYDMTLKAAKLTTDSFQASPLMSNYSDEDLYWLYRLTEAESGGEVYEGRVAVAATVLNRVEHPDWPNTIKETIFQVVKVNGINYYQFEPVQNNYIKKVTPSEDTIKAVHAALNGVDPTNGAVVFYNPDKTSNKWVLSRPIVKTIGGHVFAL